MIRSGDRVCWDEQPGRRFESTVSDDVEPGEIAIIPAGRGIVWAVARGEDPGGGNPPEGAPSTRSYIVRSDERRPYLDRRLLWLTEVGPEDPDR